MDCWGTFVARIVSSVFFICGTGILSIINVQSADLLYIYGFKYIIIAYYSLYKMEQSP